MLDDLPQQPPSPADGNPTRSARAARTDPAVGIGEPVLRFQRRVESIATLLQRQIEAAASFHDLSKRQLLDSHRSVLKLSEGGLVPTPQEFWKQTAQPRAANLVEAVHTLLDAEADELTKALQQFATGIRLELRADQGSLDPAWTVDELHRVAQEGVSRLAATASALTAIDDLGQWWQTRLRRRAILSAWSKILVSPLDRFELLVSTAEMRLLEQPPWNLDDRLLSAFELAHSDIREHAAELEHRLQRRARAMLNDVIGEELADGPGRQSSRIRIDHRSGHRSYQKPVPTELSGEDNEPSHTIDLG